MTTMEAVQERTAWRQAMDPARPLRCAADLAISLEAVTPTHTNRDVIHIFKANPNLVCLPVVEDGIPIGMINRGIFLTGFSMPFHREIYERKSCIAFMDKTPLVVNGEISIAELGKIAVEAGSKALQDGFLVTHHGRFHGLGTGLDLLRALGKLEADRNRVIHESIAYAEIIQGSLLATSKGELQAGELLDQHLLWKPKDQVGGDAFFARRMARRP
jgi:CBS domain-containing protein